MHLKTSLRFCLRKYGVCKACKQKEKAYKCYFHDHHYPKLRNLFKNIVKAYESVHCIMYLGRIVSLSLPDEKWNCLDDPFWSLLSGCQLPREGPSY